jgi:hypothetical protein
MTHPWASNVIAGVENPRILIVGPELINNQSFEENTTNWSASTGQITLTRSQNTTTPFGDYILDLNKTGTTDHGSGQQTINYGSAIGGKKFIFSLSAKYGGSANQIFSMDFGVDSPGPSNDYTAMEYWKKFILETTMPVSALTQFNIYIYPYDYDQGIAETGRILVDNVSVREILNDIQLPLPYVGDFRHGFIPLLQSGYKLDNAANKKFYKGLVYFYSAFWKKLTATEEQNRNKIIMENQINGRDLVIFPHKDSDRCYLVSCENDKLEWSWMHGVALGHEGGIELIGNELFQMAPDDVVTSSYYDDIIIGEEFVIT